MLHLGGYVRNPVLVQVIGICPVAAAATTVINALSLSAVFTLSLILCEVTASLLLKNVPRWIRVGIYAIIGTAVVFPFMYYLEKHELALLSGLGIYLPLMAMSSFNCVHCEKYAVKHGVKAAFFDSIASSTGYCSVLIIVGIIREVLGYGTILGYDIPFIDGFNGFLMPFGGLFLIGILSAVHKARIMKNSPKYIKDIERRFVLDESNDEEKTFSYSVKNRFKKNKN